MAQRDSPAGTGNASILCRYFMHGACQKGSGCSFSHDRTTPPDLVCRFYLKGKCVYGDQCRYDHNRNRRVSPASKRAAPPRPNSSAEKKDKGVSGAVKIPSVTSLKDVEPIKSNMVPLGKKQQSGSSSSSGRVTMSPEEWVKAKEFTPGQFYVGSVPPTYASAVGIAGSLEDSSLSSDLYGKDTSSHGAVAEPFRDMAEADASLLCPFLMGKGVCPYEERCTYTHGDVCDMCGIAILHPRDLAQREQHIKECMEAHEKDMEHSFAVAASKDKTCGICMDVVLEKEPLSSRRFGILENCNHCFCLSCIRQWRCAKQFEKTIVRACPECRVLSDFVTPSELWVDTPDEKTKLIQGYKQALKEKPCRHFDQGRGECPFNSSCFYKHALPDGTLAQPTPYKPRRRQNADGELQTVLGINLWDFLETDELRRQILLHLEEDLELMNILALSEMLVADITLDMSDDHSSDNESDSGDSGV